MTDHKGHPLILTTARDCIKAVPAKWREQMEKGIFRNDPGRRAIADRLDALDTDTCTAGDVDAIIGNDSWTRMRCDVCGDYHPGATIHLGEPEDYEASCVDVCLPCLIKAGDFARAAQRDDEGRAS